MVFPTVAGILQTFLFAIAGSLVARAIAAIGFSVISFVGISFLMEELYSLVHSYINEGFTGDALHFLGILQFDIFFNMIFAAYMTRLGFLGLAAGSVKLLQFTGNSN